MRARRVLLGGARRGHLRPPSATPRPLPRSDLGRVVLAVAGVAAPIGLLLHGASNWQAASVGAWQVPGVSVTDAQQRAERPRGDARSVQVMPVGSGGWQLLIDGVPKTIRGIGYNPQYAGLGESERTYLYRRDFAAIRSTGANTIEGWFESQFDEVTLNAADDSGLA